ncbi:actin cytoskeleton organization protein [Rhizoctonia solani AG-1 IA]|uniref:Actin cytoskeleton organization protein n=1 Tax=Thanatephorus cucumeris (strain AG1-IA) TaxID=983506 RepID=L8X7E4_THACA|nr:actin cytoskeleton organization protein [Rhizoctonia solani AG-1 IA]
MSDRKLQPIYGEYNNCSFMDTHLLKMNAEALDSATPKLALQLCNKALKKQPDSALIKSLKALALIRAGKLEECIALADQLVAAKPVDENVLSTLAHVLRALDRPQDVVNLYDDAYKQHPNNEELGCQAFIAMAKMGSWRTAQQTALRLNRTFPTSVPESRYAFWAISCMMMQARAPDTPRTMKPTLLGLALRMIEALPKPGAAATPDKVWLHMSVLIDLGKLEKEDGKYSNCCIARRATDSLCCVTGANDSEKGINRFNKALELIVQSQQVVQSSLVCEELRKEAMMLAERYVEEREICKTRLEANDRNYIQFGGLIETTLAIIKKQQAGETPIPAPPAEGETEPKPVPGSEELYAETVDIFTKISQKDGADERAAPLALIQFEVDRRKTDIKLDSVAPDNLYLLLTKYFEKIGSKACCYDDLADAIASLPEDSSELSKWIKFLEDQTEDLVSASVNGLRRAVNVAKMLRTGKLTVEKISPEDEATSARKYLKAYLDAFTEGENYPETEQQPRDDLAILAASAMVSAYSGSGEFRAKANEFRAYLQIPYNARFRILLVRLYRLIGAPTLAHEHYKGLRIKQTQHDTLSHLVLARASTFCMAGDSELVGECIESSQIYTANVQETPELVARAFVGEKFAQVRIKRADGRSHHDNRDMSVIPNYQPRGQNIVDQTSMGPSPGVPKLPWLNVFLQIYIRALEDSLGPSHFTGREYSFDDESQLTPLEVEFRKFTDNLNEWLVIRELPKTEKATPENGDNTNGGSETPKSAADVPALAAGVIDYFEGARMYPSVLLSTRVPINIGQGYTRSLTKSQKTKQNFPGSPCISQGWPKRRWSCSRFRVAQGIKGIRPRASKALKDLAAAMVAFGEEAGSEAKQKSFVEDCKDLEEFTGVSPTSACPHNCGRH